MSNGFLHFHATSIRGLANSLFQDAMHCIMTGSIPGFCPQDASVTPSLPPSNLKMSQSKLSPDLVKCFLG